MIVRLEISAYEKKIENWSLPLKSNPKIHTASPTKVCLSSVCFSLFFTCLFIGDNRIKLQMFSLILFPQIKLHNRDLPAEVRAPEDFLQKTGGPNGGWDQCDHQVFLRVGYTVILC